MVCDMVCDPRGPPLPPGDPRGDPRVDAQGDPGGPPRTPDASRRDGLQDGLRPPGTPGGTPRLPVKTVCGQLQNEECKKTPGCIKVKGQGCKGTYENGADCEAIPKKKWCRKAGCALKVEDDYDYGDYSASVEDAGPVAQTRRGRGRGGKKKKKYCTFP